MSVTIKFVDPDGDEIDPSFFKPGLRIPLRLVDVVFQKTWWGLGRRAVFTFENTLKDLKGQTSVDSLVSKEVNNQIAVDYSIAGPSARSTLRRRM